MAAHDVTVLVVEPHDDTADMLTEYLHSVGFSVVAASSGEAALAHTGDFAAVLTEMSLTGHIDGAELIRTLRSRPSSATLAIIVVTAWTSPDVRALAEQAGCDAFFAKPVIPQLLADAIIDVIEKRRTQ